MSKKKERFTLRAAVYLLLLQEDKVLLLRRFNTGWQDGNYSLVSGHLEGEETVIDCMIREAKEEADITINAKDLEVVHVMHRQSDSDYIDFYLKATRWEGEIKNTEPMKCDDLRFFPLNNLPDNLIPNVRQALTNYLENNIFSEM